MDKKINVISWEEANKMLPESHPNEAFCKLVDQICKKLKKDKKDYVYHIQLEFGDKIIEKGSRFDFKANGFSLKPNENYLPKNIIDFNNDLKYTNDPLGMVVKGTIEVFIENKCDEIKYNVPLNVIEDGGMFGLFGTLDAISNIKSVFNHRDWFVSAGNSSSLIVAAPFHLDGVRGLLDDTTLEDHFFEGKPKNKKLKPEKWIKFLKKHNENISHLEIVYFPVHIFDLIKTKNSDLLFQEGWRQSYNLRNALLFDPSIINNISTSPIKIKHDKIFLNTIYNYLHKAIKGESSVFIPIYDKEHFFYKSFEEFKSKSKEYDISSISIQPFIFEPLGNSDYGILPIYMLPIFHDYEIRSLNVLLNDLSEIDKKIREDFKIMGFIEGYTSSTGGKEGVIKKNVCNKQLAKKSVDFKNDDRFQNWIPDLKNLNLTSKEFFNFILIKKNK